MQFLKTLFWVIVAVVLVLFALGNWETVTIELWGGLQADVKLPVLVIGAFLLGFLPTFLLYRARIWSLKRRLESGSPAYVANAPGSISRPPPVPEGEARRNI
jgi:putative membrane protein